MADKKQCIYCKREFVGGFSCNASPTKAHVAPPDKVHCIYCGNNYFQNNACRFSPSKICMLSM